MADEFDKASDLEIAHRERAQQAVRDAAAAIPPGEPGECDYCGGWFERLVGGACGRCRDAHRLP